MDELFKRIEAKISSETDPVVAAEYRAEKCALQIRYGEVEKSRQEIRELRARFGNGTFPRVSIWLMVLDGLLLYYESLNRGASDRLLRAVAISNALRIRDLSAISASWLSHIYFNQNNYKSMRDALSTVIKNSENNLDSWLTRLSLVVADAAQYSGDWSTASKWYAIAQRQAVRFGDRLSLGAVIFNRLAIGVSRSRVLSLINNDSMLTNRNWVNEASSADYFHRGLSMNSLPNLITLCYARAHFLQKEYTLALSYFQKLIDLNCAQSCNLSGESLLSEIAVCQARAGNVDIAVTIVEGLDFRSSHSLDLDDQLVFLGNIIEIRRSFKKESCLDELIAFHQATESYELQMKSLQHEMNSISPELESLVKRIE